MRYSFLLLLLYSIGLFSQPGPPPVHFTIVQDEEALLPLFIVPEVSIRFVQGPGMNGVTPRSLGHNAALYPEVMFADDGNTWRQFETNLYMNRKRVLQVIVGLDTMSLRIPEQEDSLRYYCHGDFMNNTAIALRFIPGQADLLAHLQAESNKMLNRQLKIRYHTENPAFYQQEIELLRAESAAVEDEGRIVLGTDSYLPNDVLSAWVTGNVMLNGDCSNNMAWFGVYPAHAFKGVELSPCSGPQLACGLPSTQWHDHQIQVPLSSFGSGDYKLVVCGVGTVFFEIR